MSHEVTYVKRATISQASLGRSTHLGVLFPFNSGDGSLPGAWGGPGGTVNSHEERLLPGHDTHPV
jgi:hypothetical protein